MSTATATKQSDQDFMNQAEEPPIGLNEGLLDKKIRVNLDEIDTILPAGRYPIKIVKVELKATKKDPENQYLNLQLEVIAGPKKGEKLFDMLMLFGKAMSRFRLALEVTGLLEKEKRGIIDVDARQLVGKTAWISIVHRQETYEGEERTKAAVAFNGYEPIDKFPLPDGDDLFVEAGDSGPATPPWT